MRLEKRGKYHEIHISIISGSRVDRRIPGPFINGQERNMIEDQSSAQWIYSPDAEENKMKKTETKNHSGRERRTREKRLNRDQYTISKNTITLRTEPLTRGGSNSETDAKMIAETNPELRGHFITHLLSSCHESNSDTTQGCMLSLPPVSPSIPVSLHVSRMICTGVALSFE